MKRPIVLLIIVLLMIGGALTLRWYRGKPSLTFTETAATRGDILITIAATGTIQPENRLEIKAPIAGRAESILVKEGQKIKKGQILAWVSSTERAALLDAARAKGDEELKRWEEIYKPTPVFAPISGTVILRNLESGQTFTNTDPILVMSNRLTVKTQVDETDIAQIALKQEAHIILDAYPAHKILARVDQIAFEAKTVNNVTNYTVDVLPDSTPDFMRSGMTANVTFYVASKKNVLVIPVSAVKVKQGKATALVKPTGSSSKNPPLERTLVLGLNDGKQAEVVTGLSEGERVLSPQLNSGEKLRPGSNPLNPMGSGGGGRPRNTRPAH